MKVHLWAFGSPSDLWVQEGEQLYANRIQRYMPFEYKTILRSKSSQKNIVLSEEANWLTSQIEKAPSKVILLDENGPQLTSRHFASKLETWRLEAPKRLIFLIGSAYGFQEDLKNRFHEKLSLSKLTLPHQLCRLVFLEQLYRACTILKGESYHHD